jgi:hypothetical protein
MRKAICNFFAFCLFFWAFTRNVLDVRAVFMIIGGIGWLIMGEEK